MIMKLLNNWRFYKNNITRGGMSAESIRFLFVGGVNTGGGYVFYLLLLWLGTSPVWSYSISYAVGLVVSYYLHLKVTFRTNHSFKKILLFPLVNIARYITGLLILKVALSFGMAAEWAGLLVIIITVPIYFFCARFVLR